MLEDNEATIKICNKGRILQLRHIPRVHRVDLDLLFERVRDDKNLSIKFVGTKYQIADIFTKGSFSASTWSFLCKLANIGPSHQPQSAGEPVPSSRSAMQGPGGENQPKENHHRKKKNKGKKKKSKSRRHTQLIIKREEIRSPDRSCRSKQQGTGPVCGFLRVPAMAGTRGKSWPPQPPLPPPPPLPLPPKAPQLNLLRNAAADLQELPKAPPRQALPLPTTLTAPKPKPLPAPTVPPLPKPLTAPKPKPLTAPPVPKSIAALPLPVPPAAPWMPNQHLIASYVAPPGSYLQPPVMTTNEAKAAAMPYNPYSHPPPLAPLRSPGGGFSSVQPQQSKQPIITHIL